MVIPAEATVWRHGPDIVAADCTDVALFGCSVLAKHEHGFPTLLVELLEQDEGSLVQSQTTLLVAVHNVESILPPICGNVVFLECHGQHLVTRVVDGDTE